ncbi:MAG: DUF2807 domain-containing protein [Draconibacterium sp.]|nr:DUF2807 domain-containing protein [Draconibacterium sp.]
MKLILIFAIFSISVTSVNANIPHDEDWESRTYEMGEFTEIYLEGGYKVFLAQGDENKVIVKASDDDVFDYLKIKNIDNKLRVKLDEDCFNYDRIILYITFKKLESVKIEGGAKLKTKGYLDLNDFEMYVAGGAKIELDIKANNVRIVGEGGMLFELDGVAKSLDVKITGAGNVDADELKAKDVTIKIEGVGTASVYATETLNAKIEGVGTIKYRGNPKVTKYIDGLGSVKRD